MARLGVLKLVAALSLASGVLAGCSSDAADTGRAEAEETEAKATGKIQLFVSVDWEGRDLLEQNLTAMENLHARFPEVKIVHFLNAAYFTKKGAVAADVKAKIGRVVAPGDERGLHIHGWKRLFEAADVTFRATPTFWGTDKLSNDCNDDCGHEVPLSAYKEEELQKVIRFSQDTLEDQGFGRPESFRCGGWVAAPNVRRALVKEGIRYENSAVTSKFLKEEIGTLPLYDWVSDLWKDTTIASQPYTIDDGAGPILEVPDNGALADYISPEDMLVVFDDAVARYKKDPTKNVVVSIGFHQETAARFLPRLESALAGIASRTKDGKLPVVSVTSEDLSAPAKR